MSAHEDFDDLARRKLAEREFPVDPADWQAMERLLDKQRKPRMGLWFTAAMVVGLIGGAVLLMDDGGAESVVLVPAVDRTKEALVVPEKKVDETADSGAQPGGQAERTVPVQAGPEPIPAGEQPAIAREQRTSVQPRAERSRPQVSESESRPNPSAPSRTDVPKMAPPVIMKGQGPVIDGSGNTGDVPAGTTMPTDPKVVLPDLHLTPEASGEAVDIPMISDHPSPVVSDPVAAVVPAPKDTTAQLLLSQRVNINDEPVVDRILVQDSAAVPPADASAGWMPSTKCGLEFTALGGALFSTSRFHGLVIDDWKAGTEGLWTPIYGGELVFGCPHFGVGLGLQQVTYSERLDAEAIMRDDLLITTDWSFESVPVTLPMVVDTQTINGTVYYVTIPVDTFLNQLVRDDDTTLVTVDVRDARTVTNRIGYWESSLVLDVHTSKGRWDIGARSGLTFGTLLEQRGALPDREGDGYASFDGRTFRTQVWGYHARAYLRYRFAGGFFVGVEPGVRGSLGNVMGGDLLRRNNSALALQMSLGYRFNR